MGFAALQSDWNPTRAGKITWCWAAVTDLQGHEYLPVPAAYEWSIAAAVTAAAGGTAAVAAAAADAVDETAASRRARPDGPAGCTAAG